MNKPHKLILTITMLLGFCLNGLAKTCKDLNLGKAPVALSVLFDYKKSGLNDMFLSGVQKDGVNFKNINEKLFGVSDTKTIGDSQAESKAEFLAALRKNKGAKIFEYSGHGSRCSSLDPATKKTTNHFCVALPITRSDELQEKCLKGAKRETSNYDQSLIFDLQCQDSSGKKISDYLVTEEEISEALGNPEIMLLDSCHSGQAKTVFDSLKLENKSSTLLLISSALAYQESGDSDSGGSLAVALSKLADAPNTLSCEIDLVPDGVLTDREIGMSLILNSLRIQNHGGSPTDGLNSAVRGSVTRVELAQGTTPYNAGSDQEIPDGIFSDLCIKKLDSSVSPKCQKRQSEYKKSAATCVGAAEAGALSEGIQGLIDSPKPLESIFAAAAPGSGKATGIVGIEPCTKAVGTQKIQCAKDANCSYNKFTGIVECGGVKPKLEESVQCSRSTGIFKARCVDDKPDCQFNRSTGVQCATDPGCSKATGVIKCGSDTVATEAATCTEKALVFQRRESALKLIDGWAAELKKPIVTSCTQATQAATEKLELSINKLKKIASVVKTSELCHADNSGSKPAQQDNQNSAIH